ncbi:MAG: FUSC family protein [Bacteroidales bacterium]|nr:FUSC family protein [Bacteroidales bacterium]
MTHYLNLIKNTIKKIWLNVFWKSPPHLWALKVTVSIAILVISTEILFDNSFIATILALGVVAMALAETDSHPRGRLKSAAISLLLFLVSSSIVGLLSPYPIAFGIVLGVMIFSLTLMAGINSRLQGVTFGTLLIITYTMLGVDVSEQWFHQPLLYVIGGSIYSIVSVLLLYFRPLRLLRGELSSGFSYLAEYIHVKAKLFPSKPEEQDRIRNQLAQQSIQLAQQIEVCKRDLHIYSAESDEKMRKVVDTYYCKWFLLQEMQERATSSHEQYDILSGQVKNPDLIEGFGQLMRQIANAMHLFAESLLTGETYKHPISLVWTVSALKNMLDAEKETNEAHYSTLSLLMKNLSGLEESLRNADKPECQVEVPDLSYQRSERKALSTILTPKHPRFRFSVRLTLCMVLGYSIMHLFNIEKGAWILLTSLIVVQQTYSATRQRLFHRIFGTLMGVVLGVGLAQVLPTLTGQILLMLCTIYAFFFWLKKNYTIAAIFITIYVLAAFNLLAGVGVAVMTPRIIDTLIGGFLAYVVVRFIWPDWQYKQLPVLLHRAIAKNKHYFQSIYDESVTETEYLEIRRTANNADNALTSSWKDMRREPKSKRRYQQKAFRLTNLNHALLSYISAFGVHIHKTKDPLGEDELLFCDYISHILQFVTETMSQNVDDSLFGEHVAQANKWGEEIAHAKYNTNIQRMALIHNIAHVSRELLEEAQKLRKVHEAKVEKP